jgi:sec-independent protein translocase protein TatA
MVGLESPSHWFILAVVVVILFGYKKLPDAARSIGRSLRIFKTEMKGLTDDDAARAQAATTVQAVPAAPAAQTAPAVQTAPAAPAAPEVVTPAATPAAPAQAPAPVAEQPVAPEAAPPPVADAAIENPTAPPAI